MSKEAMKLALEALGNSWTEPGNKQYEFEKEAITALREALAEQSAQQEPLQNNPFDCGVYLGSGKDHVIKHRISHKPAQQEPVAWMREEWGPDCGPYIEFYRDDEMGWRDRKEWTALYTSPPAQRTWVHATEWRGLTDEDSQDVIQRAMHSITGGDNTFTLSANKIWVAIVREVEAKLKEKNT